MFSDESKTLLKNVLRHTKTHNRLLEEADMWKQWEDHRGRPSPTRGPPECRRRTPIQGSPKHDGRRHMDRGSGRLSRAHMDAEPTEGAREESSTYWRRHLLKVEEEDPGRWGHSGFKELYKEFDSDAAQSDSDGNKHTRLRGANKKCKKKQENHKGKTTKEKNRSSRKGKHHRHRCKTVDGDVLEDGEPRRKRSKRHKKHSDRYAWVEKPVATSSEELPGNKNNLQWSSTRVEDGQSIEASGHHVNPAQTESSPQTINHKEHSSSHKCRHRKRKSKHKSNRKRKRDRSSVDSTSNTDT